MLSGRRERQIFQTMIIRLDEGEKNPPEEYGDEEKEFYMKVLEGVQKDRAEGRVSNYDFPNNYD